MRALVIGGNRFFGKILVEKLIENKFATTVLNRGSVNDGFGDKIMRIRADRSNPEQLQNAVKKGQWDIVFDQVAFDAKDARLSREVFRDKTKKYVFVSSQSVYTDAGQGIKETVFDAGKYRYEKELSSKEDYAEAKKQAEHEFSKATFPVICVRIPIVLGKNEYTGRLNFHRDHLLQNKPMYFPNLDARISFIEAADAAKAIFQLGLSDYSGPVNCASENPISMKAFINILEKSLNQTAVITTHKDSGDHSPFGIEDDWFMNTDLAKSIGITTRPIENWLSAALVLDARIL